MTQDQAPAIITLDLKNPENDMPEQNAQPVQVAQQTTQPSLPAPQEPGFTQTDPNDFTFGIDESTGQMIIVPRATETRQSDVLQTSDLRFQQAVEEAATTTTVTEPNPLEEKVTKLESMMGQLGMLLQGIMQGQGLSNLNQQPQQQQQEEIDLSDGLDGQTLIKIINSAVENAISSKLQPVQENQNLILMRQEYNDAAFKYGQDFITLTPAMVELKKSDPNISWEVAFNALSQGAKLLNGKKSTASDSTIQTANGSNGNGKPQAAQALVQKAQQMSTEQGGQPRTIVSEKTPIKSVQAAFDKAFADLYGS